MRGSLDPAAKSAGRICRLSQCVAWDSAGQTRTCCSRFPQGYVSRHWGGSEHERLPRVVIEVAPTEPSSLRSSGASRARLFGVAFVFLWFLIGGVAHFVATDTEMRIVPPYIPWPRAIVVISGVFELLGAAALLYPRTRRAAGLGLVALTIAVTPAHIYMLERPDLFAVPYWALVLRLPLQVALLVLIAWSTALRPAARRKRVQ